MDAARASRSASIWRMSISPGEEEGGGGFGRRVGTTSSGSDGRDAADGEVRETNTG